MHEILNIHKRQDSYEKAEQRSETPQYISIYHKYIPQVYTGYKTDNKKPQGQLGDHANGPGNLSLGIWYMIKLAPQDIGEVVASSLGGIGNVDSLGQIKLNLFITLFHRRTLNGLKILIRKTEL